ncbi:MAG: hypothetical protein H0Z34_01395 [Brevibacillus sp.]|nr:hypothetical protein [Brevibacillus sp.]
MRKKVGLCILTLLLVVPAMVSAAPYPKQPQTKVTVAPATETTQNGIPESELADMVRPTDVIVGPVFHSYDPDGYVTVKKFREIITFEHDNTRNSKPYNMSVTVTRSESQGSEWNGSLEFTGEIKAGILAELNSTVGVEHKTTRATNEAVGAKGDMEVDPGKTGFIRFWYKGRTTDGTVRVYYYNTADPSNRTYVDKAIDATVFVADHMDVFSEAWQE